VAVPNKKSGLSKKGQVEEMFNNISPRYDLLNHLLSANIDKIWRKNVIKKIEPYKPKKILDIATGTGDFAIAASRIEGAAITGIDISEGMLKVGQRKVDKRNLSDRIKLIKADSESLPFEDNSFDAVMVGFGVRNFENLEKGLSEIVRVLKPEGVFFVLEFSKPKKTPFKQVYRIYFNCILPFIGRIISKDKSAYAYLPESVNEFPCREDFLSILAKVDLIKNTFYPQTFGIATIYESHKSK
jgi:demethylmenaquinone methyltransferase/2-methoxy-6-polyprenyl-1,4-benzoquinol methylase